MRRQQVYKFLALFGTLAAAVYFAIFPVRLAHSLLTGEKATAAVAECELVRHDSVRRPDTLVCTGTWRTESGGTGSGRIHGADRSDVGTDLPGRIGPNGRPWVNGFSGAGVAFLPLMLSAPVVLALAAVAVIAGIVVRTGRRRAASLLADPAGGTLLIVTKTKVEDTDGLSCGTLSRPGPPPSGYRTVEARSGPDAYSGVSPLDLPGFDRRAVEFRTLAGPGGTPLAIIEFRERKGRRPEYVLRDPSGAGRALIRRNSAYPLLYQVLDADGGSLGSAEGIGRTSTSLVVKDEAGATTATIAHTPRRCVVRVEDTAPPPFRDIAVLFAFTRFRRHDPDG